MVLGEGLNFFKMWDDVLLVKLLTEIEVSEFEPSAPISLIYPYTNPLLVQ